MQQDILINWSPQETRVAMVEHGAVQELHVERTLERGLVGNVYLGKVARVLPGMQAAFIDIGLERAAFLHVADVWHPPAEGETISAWPSNTWRSMGMSACAVRAALMVSPSAGGCQTSATCKNAARSSPMSINADCMPGNTRATLPK